jgi:glycosyltransferase involved in cell wall biosynthesis
LGEVHFIAPSEEMMRKAKKAGLADIGSLSVIPNPIDPRFLESTTSHAFELESKSNDFVLGFIAQNLDDPNKRISKAFDLVRSLHDRQIDVKLEIVGGGGDKLDKTISRNLGTLKANELISVARRWDALVSCSMFENAPLSIVEMASLGIPVISDETLASGGLLEKTGQTSLIQSWDSGPTDSELKSIIEMLASERSTLSSRLIEETRANFGWYEIKKQLLQVYGLETGS